MCGAYHKHLSAMHGWADVLKDWPAELLSNTNVFPSMTVPAMRGNGCEAMRWGLINRNSTEFSTKASTHNARIETVEKLWTFKDAWRDKNRCIMPLAGYFEWPVIEGKKTKFYITDKDVDGVVVAGLWEEWQGDNLSCTMITRDADDYMSTIHHRMLCYLTPETAEPWLSGEMTKEELLGLPLPNLIYFPDSQRTQP